MQCTPVGKDSELKTNGRRHRPTKFPTSSVAGYQTQELSGAELSSMPVIISKAETGV